MSPFPEEDGDPEALLSKGAFSRRDLLKSLLGMSCVMPLSTVSATRQHTKKNADCGAKINRRELVRRHDPIFTKFDRLSPLSVGNGEFAFTADMTGLQTFPEYYEEGIPLCTQSQWGWHSSPNPNGWSLDRLPFTSYDTNGRTVGYPTGANGQEELYRWLRENPHRLHLGRVGFLLKKSDGNLAKWEELTGLQQRLDLWTGILHSLFHLEGVPIHVQTCCHPAFDSIAVTVHSPLIRRERVGFVFEFPYGSPGMNAADWSRPDAHRSSCEKQSARHIRIARELDSDRYSVDIQWRNPADLRQEVPHRFELHPGATGEEFGLVYSCSPPLAQSSPATPEESFTASSRHWSTFWSSGGAVELAESHDSRALELERRVVLSQYLTAIQCSGSAPPQETGLTCNSWYGKFHLEMHWWHAAHFASWGRTELLERSLHWYESILPLARQLAREQGYGGARWPKMVGLAGQQSPSPIAPLLIWQQPHPIVFAELCYQAHPGAATLTRYRDIVFQSAEFMASFATYDRNRDRFVLGPPVIPAQENHPPRETWNPTFELEYWVQGLGVAQRWRQRLGLPPEPSWERVRLGLSELPVKDGLYLAHENCPQTFTDRNHDHPSMLGALGVLPGSKVDPRVMRRTLEKVMASWHWEDTWGWDYPMAAMTATRLGMPAVAIEALMMETAKNTWLPNGHNWQRPNLPVYLPGNGGLLSAIARMAGGWKGSATDSAPGFPRGSWIARWESLVVNDL